MPAPSASPRRSRSHRLISASAASNPSTPRGRPATCTRRCCTQAWSQLHTCARGAVSGWSHVLSAAAPTSSSKHKRWRCAAATAGPRSHPRAVKARAAAPRLGAGVAGRVVLGVLVLAAAAQHPRPLGYDVEKRAAGACRGLAPAWGTGRAGVSGAAASERRPRSAPNRLPTPTATLPQARASCAGAHRGSATLG